MAFFAGRRSRSRCTAAAGAKKKALPLWKRQSQKKHFLQSRQLVVEQKNKNSWAMPQRAVRIAADKTAVSCKKAERSTFRNAVLIPKASVLLQKTLYRKKTGLSSKFQFFPKYAKKQRKTLAFLTAEC